MKLNNEAKVGLMITVAFTVFISMVALLAKINVSQSGYQLRLYFGFLNGLAISAPVRIAGGITIGYVEGIKQSGEKTEVTIWIDKKYSLLKTARFAIFTTGLIGEKYINVFIPPSVNVDDFYQDGDKAYANDPASFMKDESGGEILADIFLNSKKFVANLNNIADENRYDVRKAVLASKAMIVMLSAQTKTLMDQLNKLTGNMAQLSEKNKEEISITIRNLSEITSSLNKIVFRLENGKGTLGKLLVEEDIYYNLKDASLSAKKLFKSLEKNPSKLFFKPKQK